ncbi:uncharacterized protein TNCT_564222 [Trichonephila clavata]|uniref:G-protein coupled receptors family 1 profile domain-containing protein n=1 Tax=Trichonephila clavata TaxID=2740835 RepID=A0A8X6L9S1_TRICU|nr:uncharacterized protein TNCT_564222 [Trichonephila clavata]
MDSVLYSWLAAAAVAPFVVILSCWTLAVFRSYRSDWRLLDIFLYALACMEMISALFSFGYSILGAIRPALEAPCRFIIWGLTATRVFHLSAVTSLLLDRALASKWPSTYRSSVRHSQVRYHVIVLAIISVFVGVTSVFARLPSATNSCSLHPLDWDIKFSAFLSCVYALLLITGFGCCFAVQASRFRSRSSYRTSCSRDSGTSNSSGSCDETRDLEWAVVASICWLSYMVNHGPYLVLTTLGMAVPTFWSPWLDNSVVWLRLVQGLMVPCVLLLADMPHRSALRNMLRQSGRIYRHLSDHGGFRMQIGETTKAGFPPFPAYHAPPFPQRLRWSPANLPSLQSLQPLDVDSLRKGYGSAGYTTLLSLPSSTTSFSSPFSSCSSAGQSFNSVTTNAVNDFVFRRPSVLALFEPSRTQEGRRCDTPTPFAENQDTDTDGCHCSIVSDQESFPRETISKNMINIILAYENPSTSTPEDVGTSENNEQMEESFEDRSSSSSESSDADSVQSVIIRQRVDQRGRVSASDISRVEKKLFRCDRDTETDSSTDNVVTEQRVIYSEYL